jgi:hypothetical protein
MIQGGVFQSLQMVFHEDSIAARRHRLTNDD